MNKTVSIIVFAVLAVAVIWGAVWYNNKNAQEAQQAAARATAAAQQAAQAQQQALMSELTIKDTTIGTGAVAQDGDTVTVNYTGTLDNGTVFDSSLNPGRTPFSFTLGPNSNVIQGWNLGVLGMKVGGTRELTIPPDLGYGAHANGPIPANSTLHFTITLLSVSSSTSATN